MAADDDKDLLTGSQSPLQINVTELDSVKKAMRGMPQGLPPSAAGVQARQPAGPLPAPGAGAPSLLDRLASREKEADDLEPQIAGRYGNIEKQYGQAQQTSSALKDLLTQTAQRIQTAQMGPTRNEAIGRMAGALGQPTGLGGLGAAFGNVGTASANIGKEQREGELQRTELMAKYGIDANQAQQMSNQYGIQASTAGLSGLQTRMNQANSGADRLATAYGAQQNAAANLASKYDPATQGELAYYRALNTMRGNMAGAGIGGGSGAGGGSEPNPLTKAYASYQVAFPSPPNKASPVQLAQYNAQLQDILAVNPDFQQGNKAIADKARTAFNTGPQQGQKVEFLNNVASHLDQYDKLMQTLQQSGGQSDSPMVNSMVQMLSKQMGHPEVTNLEALQPLLADEMVKSLVPNAGTGVERQHQMAQIISTLAPDQWGQKKQVYEGALGTQFKDLERQYRSSLYFMPKPFLDKEWGAKVSPEAQQMLGSRDQASGQHNYNSAAEVAAAYKGGTLDRVSAEAILKQNGWSK